MARPRKKPEDRRQLVSIRLDPEVKSKLEAHAEASGQSLAAEIEMRCLSTLELDRTGIELIEAISRAITLIQRTSGKRWHRDLKTWAAVECMLSRGPIQDFLPDDPEEDEEISKATGPLREVRAKQTELTRRLADIGIAAPSPEPRISWNAAMQSKAISYAKRMERLMRSFPISEIADEPTKSKAEKILGELNDLDSVEVQALEQLFVLMEPYREAKAKGERIFEDLEGNLANAHQMLGKTTGDRHVRRIWRDEP